MAIKEFVIVPQNYFAEGYFAGDYTERLNQSRSALTCDADRIVGFEFQAGFFFQTGFIQDGMFGVNSVIATMQVEAMVVQVAEISAGSYYVEGYYAVGYYENRGSSFTLTAELEQVGEVVQAIGSFVVETAVAVTVAKIVGAVSDITAEFTQTATISHIEGADLFAFAEAQLAIQVDRIRDNNIEATAVFDVGTDAVRTVFISAAADSLVNFESVASASRGLQAALDAAFSSDSVAGNIKQGAANFASAFTPTLTADAFKNSFAVLEVSSQFSVDAIKTSTVTASFVSNFTQATQARAFTEFWISEYADQTTATSFGFGTSDSQGNVYSFLSVSGTGKTLIKRDRFGTIQWSRQVSIIDSGPAGTNRFHLADDNNLYVIGANLVGSHHQAVLIKLNADGEIQWQRILIQTNVSIVADWIDTDNLGNVLIHVRKNNADTTSFVIKYNSSGTLIWQRLISETGQNLRFAIDSQNNIIFRNVPNFGGSAANAFRVSKIPSSGDNFVFRKFISLFNGSTSGVSVQAVVVDSRDNILLLGQFQETLGSTKHYKFIYKLNSLGDVVWRRMWEIDSFQTISNLQLTEANNPVIVSPTGIVAEFSSDNGNLVRSKKLSFTDKPGAIVNFGLSSYSNGSIFATGNYFTTNPTIYSAVLIKLPGNGTGEVEPGFAYEDQSLLEYSNTLGETSSNDSSVTNNISSLTASSTTAFSYTTVDNITDVIYNIYNGGIYQNTGAVLNTNVTLVANFGSTISAGADLSSATTVSVSANKLITVNASLFAEGFLVSAFGRIRPFASLEDTEFTLSADVNAVKPSSATLESSTELTTVPTKTFGEFTVPMTCSTDLTAIAQITSGSSAELTSQGFLVSAFGRIRPDVADLSAAFELTVQAFVGVVGQSSLSSEFAVALEPTKQIGVIIIGKASQFTVSATAQAIPSGSVSAVATTELAVEYTRLRLNAAVIESNSSVAAEGAVNKEFAISVQTTADLTAQALRIQQLTSEFASVASSLSAVNKVGDVLVDLATVATLDIDARVNAAGVLLFESQTQLAIATAVNKPFASDLAVTAQLEADGNVGLFGVAGLSSDSNLAANARAIVSNSADLSSEFAIAVDTGAIRDNIALQFSFADAVVDAQVIRGLTADAEANTVVNAEANRIRTVTVALSAEGFVLSSGRVIDLEASAIWRISADNSYYDIPKEIRIWTIGNEVREYKIKETV